MITNRAIILGKPNDIEHLLFFFDLFHNECKKENSFSRVLIRFEGRELECIKSIKIISN